jgi:opacity protein-like surface antigen
MRKRAWILASFLFFVLAASPAFGQVGIYAGLFGGFSSQHLSLPDVDFDADGAFVYGAKVGLRILMLGIEASWFRAVHDISLHELVLLDWNGQTVDYNFYGLNLKLYLFQVLIRPYLTAGFGYYTADISEIGDDGKGGYNFGGGLELALGKKFSLGVEGKWHHVTLDVNILHPNLTLGDFTLTGGFNIHF